MDGAMSFKSLLVQTMLMYQQRAGKPRLRTTRLIKLACLAETESARRRGRRLPPAAGGEKKRPPSRTAQFRQGGMRKEYISSRSEPQRARAGHRGVVCRWGNLRRVTHLMYLVPGEVRPFTRRARHPTVRSILEG